MSLVRSLGRASHALKDFQAKSAATDRAMSGLRSGATRGEQGLKNIRTAAQGSTRELDRLKSAADKADRSLAKAGRTGVTSGTQVGQFKKGADNASKGMNGLNKSMRGNFIARLMELFMPLIEKVVDMATRSKTMQKVLQVAFDAVKRSSPPS